MDSCAQRLDRPYLRGADGRLAETSWETALAVLAERFAATAPERMASIAGNLADCDSLYALKSLFQGRGCNNLDCRQEGGGLGGGGALSASVAWLFNSTIAGIEEADAVLLVGCNPRDEGALVNARLRKRFLQGGSGGVLPVARVGAAADLTYAVEDLGASPQVLEQLLAGEGFAKTLAQAERPFDCGCSRASRAGGWLGGLGGVCAVWRCRSGLSGKMRGKVSGTALMFCIRRRLGLAGCFSVLCRQKAGKARKKFYTRQVRAN